MGIGLNAETGIGEIGLKFDRVPSYKEKAIDKNVYGKSVQVDIKLERDGILVAGELDAPITITMKIPAGLTNSGVWIFHYHEDEMDVIRPVVNADNTITFSVTCFSTFIFANKVTVEPESIEDENYYFDEDKSNRENAESNWKGKPGWQNIRTKWYCFNDKGKLVLGWVLDTDGKWYYMKNDGSMATKWVCSPESGRWYYLEPTNGNEWFDVYRLADGRRKAILYASEWRMLAKYNNT